MLLTSSTNTISYNLPATFLSGTAKTPLGFLSSLTGLNVLGWQCNTIQMVFNSGSSVICPLHLYYFIKSGFLEHGFSQ